VGGSTKTGIYTGTKLSGGWGKAKVLISGHKRTETKDTLQRNKSGKDRQIASLNWNHEGILKEPRGYIRAKGSHSNEVRSVETEIPRPKLQDGKRRTERTNRCTKKGTQVQGRREGRRWWNAFRGKVEKRLGETSGTRGIYGHCA